MNSPWNFAYLLPHTLVRSSIECGPLALVPPNDARIKGLASANSGIAKLMSSFTDQFGDRIEPSAILVHSGSPASVDFYAVASFRNAIAMSSVVDGMSFQLSGGSANYPVWSDYFDFYPFTVATDGDLIARSVACMETNRSGDFRGQRAPHLPSNKRLSFGFDQLVLERCFQQWNRKFIQNRAEWKTRVLFRSLEMAYQAMRVPAVGTRMPTIHDIGSAIALWVSAFEILSHPKKGKANLGTVLNLLGNVSWLDATLKMSRFKVEYPRHTFRRIDLIQKLYVELYRARNAFLHGNRVTPNQIYPMRTPGGPTLLHCAPLIYRAALLCYLPDGTKRTKKGDLATQLAALLSASSNQSRYEKAVRACKP
jgi:hypothetical protein